MKKERRNMNSRIVEYAKALDQVSRERRRDFHRFAETAWLEDLGYYQQGADGTGV